MDYKLSGYHVAPGSLDAEVCLHCFLVRHPDMLSRQVTGQLLATIPDISASSIDSLNAPVQAASTVRHSI